MALGQQPESTANLRGERWRIMGHNWQQQKEGRDHEKNSKLHNHRIDVVFSDV
jgi:hypothetical protein